MLTQLESICARQRRREWLTASAWAVSGVSAVGMALVGIDWLLGVADPVGRLVLTITFLVASVWILSWWRKQVAAIVITPLQIAHRVERRYPRLRGKLASAWEFAHQSNADPTAGSESLRRAVVLHATSSIDDVDWDALVLRRPLRRGAMAGVGVSLVACVVGMWVPQTMATGLTRLLNPMSTAEWPRDHDLHFIEPPTLLAEGADLILNLADTTGKLPGEVTMHYRTRRQGRWVEETQPITVTGQPQRILRSNVRASMEFRAVGGDHYTMAWHQLEVIAGPRIEEMQLIVHPPKYTELASYEWKPNTTVFAGSQLELTGRVDQQLAAANLVSESGEKVAVAVVGDRREFRGNRTDWEVQKSGRYRVQFSTRSGLTTLSRREIPLEVVLDQAPSVRFVEPTEDLIVLPTTRVPLSIKVTDELGVQQIDLLSRRSDRSDSGEQRIAIWQAENATKLPRSQQVEYALDLASWELAPGTQIELHAQALDAQPMTGQSQRPLRLNVVSESQLWTDLLGRQSRVADTLATMLREQRDLLAISREWSTFPGWKRPRWATSSYSALYRQRQITAALDAGHESAVHQLEEILAAIRRNQLLRPEAVVRLERVQELLEELLTDPLLVIEESLSEFARVTGSALERDTMTPLITRTIEQQQVTARGLKRAIDVLMPGTALGRLERELTELERDQQELLQICQMTLAPKLLSGEESDSDVADLDRAVRSQNELARRLSEVMLNMSQIADRLAASDPAAALRLAETVALGQELNVQSTMQSASTHLTEVRLGSATTAQGQALDQLTRLRNCLAGRDQAGSNERLKKLQATERDLERLRRRTANLEKQLTRLTPEQRRRQLHRLRREREEIARQSEELARKLERLRIPKAAKTVSEAGEQFRRGSLDRETTKLVRKQLDEAQRQLATERRRQQVALARLQMAKLDAKLKAVVGQQEAILHEIRRLDDLREQVGSLGEPQRQSVRQIEDRQRGLRVEALDRADRLDSLPVFRYLLQQACESMNVVASRLQNDALGPETQSKAEYVISQLSQIIESLDQERKNLEEPQQQAGGGGEQQPGDTPQAQTLQLAIGQLRLLKSLQTDLRDATKAMESALASSEQPEYSRVELALRQQELTALAQQLVPEPVSPPTEEPFPNLEDELEKSLEKLLQ